MMMIINTLCLSTQRKKKVHKEILYKNEIIRVFTVQMFKHYRLGLVTVQDLMNTC